MLLDSEGIDAPVAEGQNDNQIFSLTVLLASILIYNSKNVPKRGDLNSLKYPFQLFSRAMCSARWYIVTEYNDFA